MRIKTPITTALDVPFELIRWNGISAYVGALLEEGWEITFSSQTRWRVQSPNEYYYFRQPESKMLIRVTWEKGSPNRFEAKADFMCHEKYIGHKFRKYRQEEAAIAESFELTKTSTRRLKEIVETDDVQGQTWLQTRDDEMFKDRLAIIPISELLDIVAKRLPPLKKKKVKQKPSAVIINLEEYAKHILENNQQKELKWTKI